MSVDPATLVFDGRGLIPVIVQQWDTGTVLMLAWMDATAVAATLAERRTVFWSRSRQEYWRKGETSGHIQHLISLQTDCDRDTLLARVDQVGQACHTGTYTCFDGRELDGSDPAPIPPTERKESES
ncbi:MAG: phosphoribosyl-AMP cyclohydrolase [Microbacteriaceae bacterium]|jgi:phosphoribosyl-AMP cyclohydrolase|nr:phosphoribosyl-AMP cyclohydrolase [Microbacteriaceae bacterium]MCI1206749.1 phosphoribosyl-AMP cyclohydrolase [Microbacteriaceae bacterium]